MAWGAAAESVSQRVGVATEHLALGASLHEPLPLTVLVSTDEPLAIELDPTAQVERSQEHHLVRPEIDGANGAPPVALARRVRRVVDHRPPLLDGVAQRRSTRVEPPRVAP